MIIIPTKWLFHWGYTPFSDIPTWWKWLEHEFSPWKMMGTWFFNDALICHEPTFGFTMFIVRGFHHDFRDGFFTVSLVISTRYIFRSHFLELKKRWWNVLGNPHDLSHEKSYSGWWFGHIRYIFPLGISENPNWLEQTPSFFRGVGRLKPPTSHNQSMINHH